MRTNGTLFCIYKEGTLPEWWRYNGNTLSSSPWSGPAGRREREKVWMRSWWSSESTQSCTQRRWWDDTKKNNKAVFACCGKMGCLSMHLNARQCGCVMWSRLRAAASIKKNFANPLSYPAASFFFFTRARLKGRVFSWRCCASLFNCTICHEEEKNTVKVIRKRFSLSRKDGFTLRHRVKPTTLKPCIGIFGRVLFIYLWGQYFTKHIGLLNFTFYTKVSLAPNNWYIFKYNALLIWVCTTHSPQRGTICIEARFVPALLLQFNWS